MRNVSPLAAIAVNAQGYREILGICEGAKEDKEPPVRIYEAYPVFHRAQGASRPR